MIDLPNTSWMWIPDWEKADHSVCYLVYFRKKILLEKIPESLKLQISADSRYKLYVNGKLAELGPSKGDRQIWYLDEVELAPYLQVGENVLAVEVLRYPLAYHNGSHSIFRTETPGLYVKEKEEVYGLSAGEDWSCYEEEDFQIVSESPFFAPLHILEERKGQKKACGWKNSDFDASDWERPVLYNIFQISQAVSPGNLTDRTIPYMRKEPRRFLGLTGKYADSPEQKNWDALLAGKGTMEIPADSHVTVEIDAGELMTGYLSLRMEDGAEALVKILTAEGYVQKENTGGSFAHLPKKGDRCDWKNGYLHGFTDTYHVAGYGREWQEETYEPFWFRTYRFIGLEIQTGKEPLKITGFDYLETGYPLEVKTEVTTSDESLAPIWDISLRTLKRCMHETYEDCPFYEQLQYAMDSRSQILYTYMVSGDDRLARKCMDDFRRSARYDGMLNCSYPCYGPNVIPGFAVYYILMLHDHMMYFGDREFLRIHMGTVDGILEYFRRNLDERGLVGKVGGLNGRDRYWSFIDWTKQWDQTSGMPHAGLYGPITMESLLYRLGLLRAADVMEYLGRKQVAEEYRERAESLKKAVNTFCTDEEGMYLDGPGVKEYSQHCQVFALLTDTVTVENGRIYLERTLSDSETYAQCSVAMGYYLFRALEKAGIYEKTERQWDLWRNMLRNHLTTCVEDGVNERSDCHAWGALALYELPAVILGVRPGAPGFEKIEISPVPGYLEHAEGSVITKWGTVRVSWKREKGGVLRTVYELPEKYLEAHPEEK